MKVLFLRGAVSSALLILLLQGCGTLLSKRYWEGYYTKKATLFSTELVSHGIEIECFKYENKRWPVNFSEMIEYQPQVLPCFGFSIKGKKFWNKAPNAVIQGSDEQNALIIINELRQENGTLKTLPQAVHIYYHIEYERHFTHVNE